MSRPTRPAPPKKSDEWVVVGSFALDYLADECVAQLRGSDIPAMRFPAIRSALAEFPEQVRVLVPPDREADAKELLADVETEPSGPAEE